jgi:hypothetical protein
VCSSWIPLWFTERVSAPGGGESEGQHLGAVGTDRVRNDPQFHRLTELKLVDLAVDETALDEQLALEFDVAERIGLEGVRAATEGESSAW